MGFEMEMILECYDCQTQVAHRLADEHITMMAYRGAAALPCKVCKQNTLWHFPIDEERVAGPPPGAELSLHAC